MMPSIGTRAVHKDDHAKTKGPVWEVYRQDEPKQSVDIRTVKGHKANRTEKEAAKEVPVSEFNKDYVQL